MLGLAELFAACFLAKPDCNLTSWWNLKSRTSGNSCQGRCLMWTREGNNWLFLAVFFLVQRKLAFRFADESSCEKLGLNWSRTRREYLSRGTNVISKKSFLLFLFCCSVDFFQQIDYLRKMIAFLLDCDDCVIIVIYKSYQSCYC